MGTHDVPQLLLFTINVHANMAVLFEAHGLSLFIKIALLLLIPVYEGLIEPILISVLFIGVIGSHMPKRIRHKVLFFEKFIVPDERGG